MYIFLDLDGVLVKEDLPGATIDPDTDPENIFKFHVECRNYFEEVVLRYVHAKIVITSAWLEICTIDVVKSCFSKAVADRVMGATPRQRGAVKYFRHLEVLDYIEQNHLGNIPWVAIDDIAKHYPPTVPIIVTDPYRGFDLINAEQLDYFLRTGTLANGSDSFTYQ